MYCGQNMLEITQTEKIFQIMEGLDTKNSFPAGRYEGPQAFGL
jgi:hypothetical protein